MLIVGNWKAYVEMPEEAKKLMVVVRRTAKASKHKVVVAPSAPHLALLKQGARSKVAFAAQDISLATTGAATGELPASMLKRSGATYAILGHSERRARGETNEQVGEKVARALTVGLMPIVCIGERERDHDAEYLQELRAQLSAAFAKLLPKDKLSIVIAYEPVWAIGKSATDAIAPTDLAEMILYIRKLLSAHVPAKDVGKIKILYGGSVEAGSIRGLAGGSQVDGFLIGHASADPKMFADLMKAIA